MRSDTRWIIGLLIFFLGAGVLFSLLVPPTAIDPAGPGELWIGRQFDLLIQLGLFFAGALGIRALLPGEEEEEE